MAAPRDGVYLISESGRCCFLRARLTVEQEIENEISEAEGISTSIGSF